MRRRTALRALLTACALPVVPGTAYAAESLAPAAEADGPRSGLGQLAGYIEQLGIEQMLPTSKPQDVQAGALAAWRDLHALMDRFTGPGARHLRVDALQSCARAAALVAEVWHDQGAAEAARAWYDRAIGHTDQAVELAGEIGNRYSHGLAVGTRAAITAMRAKKVMPLHPQRAEQMLMEAWAQIATESGPRHTAHAMVPGVLARARALRGDLTGARSALVQADSYLWLPDYPDSDTASSAGAMSVLRYYPRSHLYTSADVLACCGDVGRARARARDYLGGPGPQPIMNATVIDIDEALCRMHTDGPDAAADHLIEVVQSLPRRHRSAVVVDRVVQLTRRLEGSPAVAFGAAPASVRSLRELVDTELVAARR